MRIEQDFTCFCALIRSLKTYSPGARIVCPASPGRASFVHKKTNKKNNSLSFLLIASFFYPKSTHFHCKIVFPDVTSYLLFFFVFLPCFLSGQEKHDIFYHFLFKIHVWLYDVFPSFLNNSPLFFLNFSMTCFFFLFARDIIMVCPVETNSCSCWLSFGYPFFFLVIIVL